MISNDNFITYVNCKNSYIYNGEEQTYELETSDYYEITGTLTKVDAGSNDIIVSLKDVDNYEWEDGSTTDLTFTFNIKKEVYSTFVFELE